jgi:hypothetical protein
LETSTPLLNSGRSSGLIVGSDRPSSIARPEAKSAKKKSADRGPACSARDGN